MALELAKHNPVYEDIASKFFEVRSFRDPETPSSDIHPALHLYRGRHDLQRG